MLKDFLNIKKYFRKYSRFLRYSKNVVHNIYVTNCWYNHNGTGFKLCWCWGILF